MQELTRSPLSSSSSFPHPSRTTQNLQPWGPPSSPISIASLDTPKGPIKLAFLARHGPHHNIPPSAVPARANIAALKHLGVKAIVGFSAVGSLREEIRPGDIIIPDQIIDRTKVRALLPCLPRLETLSLDPVVEKAS